jgi:hypothetical protein
VGGFCYICSMKTHICPSCFITKPLTSEYFQPRKDSVLGFRNQCRPCQKGLYDKSTNLKKCVSCGVVKNNTSEFFKEETGMLNGHPRCKDGLTKKCLDCYKNYRTEYNQNPENKEHRKQYLDVYNEENKEKIQERQKNYYTQNSEHIREQSTQWRLNNPEKKKNNDKEYRLNNLEVLNEYKKKWANDKYHSDTVYKVKSSLRARVRMFFKYKKSKPTSEIIGCTWEMLVEHIETQFKDGMTWDNHGKFGWHIDHIVPLATAKSVDDLHKLNHYTNLQPLWWKENLQKGKKVI